MTGPTQSEQNGGENGKNGGLNSRWKAYSAQNFSTASRQFSEQGEQSGSDSPETAERLLLEFMETVINLAQNIFGLMRILQAIWQIWVTIFKG